MPSMGMVDGVSRSDQKPSGHIFLSEDKAARHRINQSRANAKE